MSISTSRHRALGTSRAARDTTRRPAWAAVLLRATALVRAYLALRADSAPARPEGPETAGTRPTGVPTAPARGHAPAHVSRRSRPCRSAARPARLVAPAAPSRAARRRS